MTLDQQAAYNAQLPTLPFPAARCPWRGATCLQPSLEKYSWDNGVNIAQTNTALDFWGEPQLLLLLLLLLKSIWQMPWECSFSNGLEGSLRLTPAASLSTFSPTTPVSWIRGSSKRQGTVCSWADARLGGGG